MREISTTETQRARSETHINSHLVEDQVTTVTLAIARRSIMGKLNLLALKQFLTLTIISFLISTRNLDVSANKATMVFPISTPKVLVTTVKLAEVVKTDEIGEQSHTKILHEHIAKHFMTSTVNPRIPLIPPASINSQIALKDDEFAQQLLQADGIT